MTYSSNEDFEHIAELLDSILNGSTEYAIIATDLEDKIVLWNRGAEHIYGSSSGEMLGKLTPINLHSKDIIDKNILYSLDNSSHSNTIDYKINAIRKDGLSIPLSVTVTPRVNLSGNTIGYLIIARDITKAREQEQFRDVLLEIAHVVTSSIDTNEMCSHVVNVISSFLDIPIIFICIFDGSSNQLTIGSQVGLCENCSSHSCVFQDEQNEVSPNMLDCFSSYSQLTINSGNLKEHVIYEYINPEINVYEENTSIIHIPLISDIALIGLLHIVVSKSRRDFLLTETQVLSLIANEISAGIQRKRLEEEIKQYAVNLEKMVKERTDQLREKDAQLVQSGKLATLGEMATGIAHEINQPLGGINLMAQGLLMAKQKGKLSNGLLDEKLNSIVDQIDRITKIINHLRTFARQSNNSRQEIRVNNPIMDVFKLVGQQLENRNIEVELDLAVKLPAVLAEHNMLEQVFLNIITNARDAFDGFEQTINNLRKRVNNPDWVNNWHKKIIIRSYCDNDNVYIEFIDNAGGIPDLIVQKIFEPFFTTKEVGKGTGLGLSISYGIIKEFSGSIEVESVEMKGCKFTIKIPALKINES